ncbi:Disease resistance protein [Quillaja saponaria]|uniref:Disease resistance protein n=1 Tax=Quillaja saponaria TaxID=32244 RepID=A0AAD7LA05_QUISA|nr:Disease resistance protein [Quillaja saponaria]
MQDKLLLLDVNWGYLIFYKSNVENLKTQVQRLEETKDRVQRDVDAAKRNGQEIHTDVQSSLSKVNELIEGASKLYGDEGRATMGCYSTGSCPNVLSRHQILEKLKDATIQTIGVWGFGGVGKTTLAKQVAKEVEASKMFRSVVMVTVSANQDVRRIQGQIAGALGLRFDEETEVGRSNRLWQT